MVFPPESSWFLGFLKSNLSVLREWRDTCCFKLVHSDDAVSLHHRRYKFLCLNGQYGYILLLEMVSTFTSSGHSSLWTRI